MSIWSSFGHRLVTLPGPGITLSTTAKPDVNIGGVFGGTWKTAHRREVVSEGSLTGTYATDTVLWEGEGHTASGATQSGLGLFIQSKKTDYLTSTTEGQILGTYTNIYGGRLGDHAAHLFGAVKVFDGTYSGGLLGIEGSIVRKDDSDTTTGHTQVYMGWSMSNTGTNFAPDGTLGFCVEPRVGETFAAFAAVERSDLAGTPSFEHVVAASTSRNNANIFFSVTGSGNAGGAGRVRAQGSAAFPAYSAIGDENTGVTFPSADQVGFSAGGVVRFWATTVHINTTVPLRYSGTQVLGAQGAAVADATDAASAITQLNALLARCRAHGLIAT